jgi:hypothetical protein
MEPQNYASAHFPHRRQLLLGTTAFFCCGTHALAASPGKALTVGGLPVT